MYRITKKSRNGHVDEDPNNIMADTLIAGTTLVEKESRSIGDTPIGGIVAWAKTLSGVPNLAEGWVECDGSVLIDSQSSLNGQTIPDLNGDNRFLRGEATSGGTGGSETHTHGVNIESNAALGGSNVPKGTGTIREVNDHTHVVNGTSAATSTLPTYYEVVWIMRVR